MSDKVKITNNENSFVIERTAVASINPRKCVNCGTCRENCPVGAIEEQQREICRICPECTSRPAMTVDEMKQFAEKQSCTTACPLGISPQGYVNLTKNGKPEAALKHIWEHNPLPSVCARVCTHPCEQACKRGALVDEPIAIRGIKRYLTDNIKLSSEAYPEIYDESIAVIGAGPAGLTTAHYLLQKGYDVTVFESESEPGGMLRRALPKYRIPEEAINRDIRHLEECGMKIECNTSVSRKQASEMMKEYDAVVIAAGMPNSTQLRIEGYEKTGIFNAMEYMEKFNSSLALRTHPANLFDFDDAKVVVIGGGAVAIDCARTAIRLGAQSVTAVCMEEGPDVPCHEWELNQAREEGMVLMDGWAPVSYPGTENEVTSVELCKCTSEKDETGKIRFTRDENKRKIIDADYVIVAIGRHCDEIWNEIGSSDKLFFAGDVHGDNKSIVDAMASGKKAAMAIDSMLRGRESKDLTDQHDIHAAEINEKIYPATRLHVARPKMPIPDAEQRVKTFEEVEGEYSKETIDLEVLRCLQCGYEKVDPAKCIGCGVCSTLCPQGDVITLEKVNAEV